MRSPEPPPTGRSQPQSATTTAPWPSRHRARPRCVRWPGRLRSSACACARPPHPRGVGVARSTRRRGPDHPAGGRQVERGTPLMHPHETENVLAAGLAPQPLRANRASEEIPMSEADTTELNGAALRDHRRSPRPSWPPSHSPNRPGSSTSRCPRPADPRSAPGLVVTRPPAPFQRFCRSQGTFSPSYDHDLRKSGQIVSRWHHLVLTKTRAIEDYRHACRRLSPRRAACRLTVTSRTPPDH